MRHCVWIDDQDGGYAVRCIPHGDIGWKADRWSAFMLGIEHDYEEGGGCV